QLVQRQIGHRLAKPFVLLLEILQLPKLVTAHAAILLAPPVIRQLRNADLANRIRHRHALPAQNLSLPKLRDDLVGLVSLVCHCGPPSWSKPYFKVAPFNGGGSIRRWHLRDGHSIREIARRTGLSRNTIRKYLRSGEVEPPLPGAGTAEQA